MRVGKYAVLLLLACAQQSFGAVSQFSCDSVIFSALTFKREKKVQVCLSGKGVTYTFGSVNAVKPELDIRVTPHEARWTNYTERVWDMSLPEGKSARVKGKGITIYNGTYSYQLFVGENGDTHYETLKVYNGNKRLEKIKLHPDTVYARIDRYLEEEYAIPRTTAANW